VVKLIAFDLVGTLIRGKIFSDARSAIRINFDDEWQEAETASAFSSHFNYEIVFRYWLDHVLIKSVYQQFQSYLLDHTLEYLYKDTVPTLTKLQGLGVRLGFVTDGNSEVEGQMIRTILRQCKINPDECTIVCGDKVKSNKAQGQPFKRLVEQADSLGILREDIIFVGDKPEVDMRGAKKAELTTVLIRRELSTEAPEEAPEDAPDHRISGLEELLNLVK
jgi:FMN phosphatase YigB (HAD superfamily)